MSTQAELKDLSTETHSRIIDLCSCNKDLRALRLTSRYWRTLTELRLFASVTIYPCRISLGKLYQISRSRTLRHLVRRLVYDATTLTLHRQPGASVNNTDLELSLCKVFPGLLSLETLSVIDTSDRNDRQTDSHLPIGKKPRDVTTDLDIHPAFSTANDRSCWFGCMTSHICAIVRALHRLPHPIGVLNLQGYFWSRLLCSSLPRQTIEVFENAFTGLKNLSLEPMLNSLFLPLVNMPDLQYVLRSAERLKSLSINFGTVQCGPSGEALSVFGTLEDSTPSTSTTTTSIHRAQLNWSSCLAHMHLYGLVCKWSELRSVLSQCATSLKSLTLCDLVLLPEVSDGRPACLVTMLRWIQHNLCLQNVMFRGHFSNEGLQQWDVTHRSGAGGNDLCSQVHNYLLNGGPCPLDLVAMSPEPLNPGDEFLTFEMYEDVINDRRFHGDESWRMSYILVSGEDSHDTNDENEDDDEHDAWVGDKQEHMHEIEESFWKRVKLQPTA